jgi:hypothetical protein
LRELLVVVSWTQHSQGDGTKKRTARTGTSDNDEGDEGEDEVGGGDYDDDNGGGGGGGGGGGDDEDEDNDDDGGDDAKHCNQGEDGACARTCGSTRWDAASARA